MTDQGRSSTGAREQRIARWLVVWSVAYAGYRGYYALGGRFGMIGRPVSEEQYQTINGVGAVIILGAALVAGISLTRPVSRVLPVVGWVAAVGCCMHAFVDMTLRVLSLTGVHPTRLPASVWLSVDRHAADLQDLLLNEPWFLLEGLLWGALALVHLRASRRRRWGLSAGLACLVITLVGVLSGLGVIATFHVG